MNQAQSKRKELKPSSELRKRVGGWRSYIEAKSRKAVQVGRKGTGIDLYSEAVSTLQAEYA
jgi:hypothetical protein